MLYQKREKVHFLPQNIYFYHDSRGLVRQKANSAKIVLGFRQSSSLIYLLLHMHMHDN